MKEALTAGTLDANAIDPKGDTLLHLAARNGHKAIVKEALHTLSPTHMQHKHTHARTHVHTHLYAQKHTLLQAPFLSPLRTHPPTARQHAHKKTAGGPRRIKHRHHCITFSRHLDCCFSFAFSLSLAPAPAHARTRTHTRTHTHTHTPRRVQRLLSLPPSPSTLFPIPPSAPKRGARGGEGICMCVFV